MNKHLILKRIYQTRHQLGLAINNNDLDLAHRIQGILLSEYSDLLQLVTQEIGGINELPKVNSLDFIRLLDGLNNDDRLNNNRGSVMSNSKPIDLSVHRVKRLAQNKPLVLVYCEKYLDGQVMTIEAYKELRKSFDRCDIETHQAVIVDADMEHLVIQTLNEVLTLEDVLALKKAK